MNINIKMLFRSKKTVGLLLAIFVVLTMYQYNWASYRGVRAQCASQGTISILDGKEWNLYKTRFDAEVPTNNKYANRNDVINFRSSYHYELKEFRKEPSKFNGFGEYHFIITRRDKHIAQLNDFIYRNIDYLTIINVAQPKVIFSCINENKNNTVEFIKYFIA